MILAFLLLAGMADWVPAHWPWADPKSLELLSGTGIDCVLVESRRINPEFVREAGERGIAVVALVKPGPNVAMELRRAERFKVQAIAIEGDLDNTAVSNSAVPLVRLPGRHNISLDARVPIAGTWQGLWPGIVIEHGGKVMAGPSSNPWIDTNTGFLRFLGAAMGCALWLGVAPPENTVIPPARYGIAIADAAAAGAHWIVTLDRDLQSRLFQRERKALEDWKRITAYAQYFERHPEWRAFRPFSRMAITQDGKSGGLLSASLLDLMYAQHIAAVSVPPSRVDATTLADVRTVINIAPPEDLTAGQQRALASFSQSGGALITPPPGWRFGADEPGRTAPSKQQLNRIQDIWEMLYNATARKNFGARSFNTAGILFNVLESPDGKRLLIHLVNYTEYPADTITLQALGTWKHARLFQPGAPDRDLAVYAVQEGTGLDLDKLDVVATVLLD